MSQSISVLTLSVKIAAKHDAGLFVTAAGALPTAGGNALGVLSQDCTVADQVLPVVVYGTAVATAASAIAVGDRVMVDAAGKVKTWADTNTAVGVALEAASADGDRIEVLLIPN